MTEVNNQLTQSINSSSSPTPLIPPPTQSVGPCAPVVGDDSSEPPIHENSTTTSSKTRPTRSNVWVHFEKVVAAGVHKEKCVHCGQLLSTGRKSGTSHLWDHYELRCTKKHAKVDLRQKLLNYNLKSDGTVKLENHNFDQDVSRKELSNMVIMHEYPLSMVDHIGFKRYTASLNPNFKLISQPTLKSDIMKMFKSETAMLRKMFDDHAGRIAITTDMWTASHQKKGYMAITSHFIDKKWNLQNKTIRFVYVPCPHTAETMAEIFLQSLCLFNIHEKVSCIVVDNCSTNDKMIDLVRSRSDSSNMMLHGAFLHVRCSAHILNLVVQDGLDVIASGIENKRSCVSYWSATPKRVQMFEDKARILKLDASKKLVLDCKTRWNSTYLMLQTAMPYKDVFAKLKIQHPRLKFDIPTDDEWKWAANICGKLSKFHELTELFSGRSYPTANLFFRGVCRIKIALNKWLSSDDLIIVAMAEKMVQKFDRYWASITGILAIAAILDPRDKMECVEWYFNKIYGDIMAFAEIEKVKSLLYDLLFEYQDDSNQEIEGQEYVSPNSDVLGKRRVNSDDEDDDYSTAKKSRKKKTNVRSELDYYLEEAVFPDSDRFDVLNHWKADLKYPTLRKIAKDILAIPVSTVASESAFSMGGRVVSPHRASLHIETVEALMCMQNWLAGDNKGYLDGKQACTVLEDLDVEEPSPSTQTTKDIEMDDHLGY